MANATGTLGVPAPGLAIIGAGFGRTGTASLQQALHQLGYGPCDHMHENFENPERFQLWREAMQRKDAGEAIDWRPLLANYRAIVDWPGAWFWRELAAAHPEAKVILSVRDADRWYDSTSATIFPLLLNLEQTGGEMLPSDIILDRTFGRQMDDRAYCLEVYAAHAADVRATIAPERLLVFDVREGWEPLCAFLGVPTPQGEPFPHLNDTAAFKEDVRKKLNQRDVQ